MSHPRQSAEEELTAAMLAVSGYGSQQQLLQQPVSVQESQALITASVESDDEYIDFE
jgi:hypothetical protein